MSRTGSKTALTALAVLLLPALAGGCGGKGGNENEIRPIVADIAITDTSSTDPQAIYLERVGASGDLVTVNVMLRTTTPVTFGAYSIEMQMDPGLISVAAVDLASGPLASCSPLPLDNSGDFNSFIDPTLIIGVAVTGTACSHTTTPGTDDILATVGLRATTTGTSMIHFISSAAVVGDCELLDTVPAVPVDLGILCVDGSPPPTLTATR